NGKTLTYAAAKPTVNAIEKLSAVTDALNREYMLQRASKGFPILVPVQREISDDDIACLECFERYCPDIASHIIGYLDSEGNGAAGIEKSFNSILTAGERELKARFKVNAYGRVMDGESVVLQSSDYYSQNGVMLTIDRDIQYIAEKALDSLLPDCSGAIVLDARSGAIRALASRPVFDRENMEKSLTDDDLPFINRTLGAYNVGSVFKTVVAAAALENGISTDFEYTCTGNITLDGVTFNCHERSGHGTLDMSRALQFSCNTYYIELARKVGVEAILETGEKMGFGRDILLADGILASGGVFPQADYFDSEASLANLAFGQGVLTASPLTVAAAMLCAVNGGEYVCPYLVEAILDEDLNVTESCVNYSAERAISEKSSETLKSMLVNAGNHAVKIPGLEGQVGGKTATAQTGKMTDGNEIYNTWYCGFFPADEPEYIIAVFNEKGNSGSKDCIPVFEEIASKINALR
ncbi:MAG: hypothetical protein IJL81_04940, partial [Clostridia bacterium]|nr:hypothetical protein [Clostridia bacterium]